MYKSRIFVENFRVFLKRFCWKNKIRHVVEKLDISIGGVVVSEKVKDAR
jgi:hypothetical protein